MDREAYRLTAEHEASHWWFRSRRDLVLAQVHRAVTETGPFETPPRLLDYGCGTGYMLDFLARIGPVSGADRESMVPDEQRSLRHHPILDLDADTRSAHGQFQVLTALDVLEHIEDDAAALREMKRYLAPGGQIVLTVPAHPWLWGGEDILSRHVRRYTRRTLAEVCDAAGLRVRFLSHFNLSVLPLAALVIGARKMLPGPPRSNLGRLPGPLNETLFHLTRLEARWVAGETIRLGAGASLICRATPAGPGAATELRTSPGTAA